MRSKVSYEQRKKQVMALLDKFPRKTGDIAFSLGLPEHTVAKVCGLLVKDGEIARQSRRGPYYSVKAQAKVAAEIVPEKIENHIERKELAPGHTRVIFGDKYKCGRALSANTGLRSGSSLNGVY